MFLFSVSSTSISLEKFIIISISEVRNKRVLRHFILIFFFTTLTLSSMMPC